MAKRKMPTLNSEPEVVAEEVTTVEAPKTIVGIVSGCKRLNVRKMPFKSAVVINEILVGSKVTISPEDSTNDWYKVCTEDGTEGFCMKKFVTVIR